MYGIAGSCGVEIRVDPSGDEALVAEKVTCAINRMLAPEDGDTGD